MRRGGSGLGLVGHAATLRDFEPKPERLRARGRYAGKYRFEVGPVESSGAVDVPNLAAPGFVAPRDSVADRDSWWGDVAVGQPTRPTSPNRPAWYERTTAHPGAVDSCHYNAGSLHRRSKAVL